MKAMTHPPKVAPRGVASSCDTVPKVNLRLITDFVNRTKHMSNNAVRNIAYEQHEVGERAGAV
jgi:hypothetical protein